MNAASILLAIGLAATSLSAQCPQTELIAPDVEAFSAFGMSVALSDGDVWVGCPGWTSPVSGDELGKVYRMNASGLVLGSFVPGTGIGSRFGKAIGVDGDTVVVGAPLSNVPVLRNGRVWIYTWNGASWDAQTFVSDPPFKNAYFGEAVAIEGDLIAVGAPGHFTPGRVHIFRRGAGVWALEQVLGTGLPPWIGTNFGQQVAWDGGRLFVTETDGSEGGGAVIVFEHDGSAWAEVARIDSPVPDELGSVFATALSVDGDRMLVTCTKPGFPSAPGPDPSRVYTYRETAPHAWTLEQELGMGNEGTNFGTAIALSGDRALVGAPRASDVVLGTHGAIYAFAHDGTSWQQTHTLQPIFIQDATQFGYAVDLDDDYALGGLLQLNDPAHLTGVQLFELDSLDYAEPWVDVGGALAGSNGTPSLSGHAPLCQGSTVTLSGAELAPAGDAFLVVGITRVDLPFKGGVLVPFPDLILGPYAPMVSDGTLELQLPIDAPVPPAMELTLQLWVANGGGPVGWAATNGLQGSSAP